MWDKRSNSENSSFLRSLTGSLVAWAGLSGFATEFSSAQEPEKLAAISKLNSLSQFNSLTHELINSADLASNFILHNMQLVDKAKRLGIEALKIEQGKLHGTFYEEAISLEYDRANKICTVQYNNEFLIVDSQSLECPVSLVGAWLNLINAVPLNSETRVFKIVTSTNETLDFEEIGERHKGYSIVGADVFEIEGSFEDRLRKGGELLALRYECTIKDKIIFEMAANLKPRFGEYAGVLETLQVRGDVNQVIVDSLDTDMQLAFKGLAQVIEDRKQLYSEIYEKDKACRRRNLRKISCSDREEFAIDIAANAEGIRRIVLLDEDKKLKEILEIENSDKPYLTSKDLLIEDICNVMTREKGTRLLFELGSEGVTFLSEVLSGREKPSLKGLRGEYAESLSLYNELHVTIKNFSQADKRILAEGIVDGTIQESNWWPPSATFNTERALAKLHALGLPLENKLEAYVNEDLTRYRQHAAICFAILGMEDGDFVIKNELLHNEDPTFSNLGHIALAFRNDSIVLEKLCDLVKNPPGAEFYNWQNEMMSIEAAKALMLMRSEAVIDNTIKILLESKGGEARIFKVLNEAATHTTDEMLVRALSLGILNGKSQDLDLRGYIEINLREAKEGDDAALRRLLMLGALGTEKNIDCRIFDTILWKLKEEFPKRCSRIIQAVDVSSLEPNYAEQVKLFEKTRSLNIDYLRRFPPDMRKEIVQNRLAPIPNDKPVALLVFPKEDENYAFYSTLKWAKELKDKGYHIIYHEASSDVEAAECIVKGTTNEKGERIPAPLIIIGGHGSKTSVTFGPDKQAGVLSLEEILALKSNKDVCDALEDCGTLIIFSCLTGSGKRDCPNVANAFREVYPHASDIIAPTYSTNIESFIFSEDGRIIEVIFSPDTEKLPEPAESYHATRKRPTAPLLHFPNISIAIEDA